MSVASVHGESRQSTSPARHGKQAVVLSGGGADGAYAVGVLKALFCGASPATQGRALAPEIFAGTSIGSYSAAFLVGQWEELGTAAVGNLERVWLDRLAEQPGGCGNGVYRMKMDTVKLANPYCYLPNPLTPLARFGIDSASLGWGGLQRLVHLMTGNESLLQRTIELVNFASFVSREPWSRTIRETIDFDAIRSSPTALRIAATNWATGELRVFDNRAMSANLGPQAVEASSALPGFFPPASVGSLPYIDGGVLLNTPLRPAIRAGAGELFVVYLDPEISALPLAHSENTLETLYRAQQISWAAKMAVDIDIAHRINNTLAWLDEARRRGDSGPLYRQMDEEYHRYSPLVIHRFSPKEDLGGATGVLDLRRERLDRLIRLGFEDTIRHDCSESGCVLVDGEVANEPS